MRKSAIGERSGAVGYGAQSVSVVFGAWSGAFVEVAQTLAGVWGGEVGDVGKFVIFVFGEGSESVGGGSKRWWRGMRGWWIVGRVRGLKPLGGVVRCHGSGVVRSAVVLIIV